MPRFWFRPILHNSGCDVRAYRAFEGSFVVAGLIRLNAREPHLRLAEFTKRTADNPLLGKCLIFPHATPFEWLARQFTRPESFNKKEPASELARLLSTNRGNRPRLFMRVINNCASKFTLPFEFDRNVAARFPRETAITRAGCPGHELVTMQHGLTVVSGQTFRKRPSLDRLYCLCRQRDDGAKI